MEIERKLVEYVVDTSYQDIPQKPIDLMKDVTLNVLGAIMAGAAVEGCPQAVERCKQWGGDKEATILIYGERVSASNAAFANSFMARAAGVDDAMLPGLHTGGSSVPTALAVAELVGGCNGKDFLTALVVGTELAARINSSSDYNGFDPTGVCAVFAAAAAAGRILRLNSTQMWNALGHAFNRSGGSFQGTIDGSIAARVLQASATQGGIMSAQLAEKGITGPTNFLDGVYGYFHLYAGDNYNPEAIGGELGKRFELEKAIIKKHPSCATTNASIDAICVLMEEKGVTPEQVAEIKVGVTPFTYTLTGKPFEYGDDPKISAMYSIQYCVANALLRKKCKLRHFDESMVRDPDLKDLIEKIHPYPITNVEKLDDLGSVMEIKMKDGSVYNKTVFSPRGSKENPLSKEELMEKFQDCASYGGKRLSQASVQRIISTIDTLEHLDDVRNLIALLISRD